MGGYLRVRKKPPILIEHPTSGPCVIMDVRPPFTPVRLLPLILVLGVAGCGHTRLAPPDWPDTSGFSNSRHHWFDLQGEDRVITPLPDQKQYPPDSVARIADNILRFQKTNGGWPKNYDMMAVLSDAQKEILRKSADDRNTTFDNGATHSHVAYLARAWKRTGDRRYSDACLRGIQFILSAQYPSGGWPQFYPDTSGYRKYITFNDGAMVGVLSVCRDIAEKVPQYDFVDTLLRVRVCDALARGVDCVLRCQISQHDKLTGWCQQHDQETFAPRGARTFEPVGIASMETAQVLMFLRTLKDPSFAVREAVRGARAWLEKSALYGIRVKTISAADTAFQYHRSASDRIVVRDPDAPRLWSRYYELGTNRPLFCNRDGNPVYSLAEVDRERRTGYAWYTDEPENALKGLLP
jgi:PelA/Pel-15E family pectate lyase